MKGPPGNPGSGKLLPLLCLALSLGLLVAGLWPFQFRPANNVHWIDGQPGLRFDRYGIVFGRDPLFAPGGVLDLGRPFTIRLELRPHEEPSDFLPRILSACDARGRELFSLGQWGSELILRIRKGEKPFRPDYPEIGVVNFRKAITQSVVIRSDIEGVTMHVAGEPDESRPGFGFSLLSGNRGPAWLILGNSPEGDSPWSGDLLSLSFYPEALSPEETGTPGIGPVVRYRFSEGKGTVCRGGGDPRHDLFIPPVFRAPAKRALTPPWKVHSFHLSFWTDAAVNVLGFIPFGFAMCAWMRKDGGRKRPSVPFLVVLAGAGISLLIELLQVYVPTRDSSLTDLGNNILGTYIGALLCRPVICRRFHGMTNFRE